MGGGRGQDSASVAFFQHSEGQVNGVEIRWYCDYATWPLRSSSLTYNCRPADAAVSKSGAGTSEPRHTSVEDAALGQVNDLETSSKS